jgi:hypothetical protein
LWRCIGKFRRCATLHSAPAEEWEWHLGHIVLQNNIELLLNKELEKNSFILNHGHRFIKSHISKGRMLHHVSYPAIDAQPMNWLFWSIIGMFL